MPVAETVECRSEIKRRSLTHHIGVSNYSPDLVGEAVRASPEAIVANRIECRPFVDRSGWLAANLRYGLATTTCSPIARGRVAGNRMLEDIGATHGRTAAQITLRWLIQQLDVVVIPKSTCRQRLEENLAIFDFTLSDEETALVSDLSEC